MKVQKTRKEKNPGYPSWRQFREYTSLTGMAVIGLSTVVAGCRSSGHTGKQPLLDEEIITTGGAVAVEPFANPPKVSPSIAGETSSYKVQKGDTLWTIAERQLGKGSRWSEIIGINPNLTPETLNAGKTILIPKTAGVTTTGTSPSTNEAADIRTKGKPAEPR